MPIPQHIDQQYQYLDRLPGKLYQAVVTLHYDSLKNRSEGILKWRSIMLQGNLPSYSQTHWPEKSLHKQIIRRIEDINIISDCTNQENLVDELLLAICDKIKHSARKEEENSNRELDDLVNRTISKRRAPPSNDPNKKKLLDIAHLPERIHPSNAQKIPTSSSKNRINQEADTQLKKNLERIVMHWNEVKSIFKELDLIPGRGWDLSKGELQKQGWREILKYRKITKDNPQISNIIERIGRAKRHKKDSQSQPTNSSIENPKKNKLRNTKYPVPMSVHGITRSDDISLMLPSEASLLNHPTLKKLWHAKRVEHALMSYRVEGVLSSHSPALVRESKKKLSRKLVTGEKKYGPIILCIDTSGSMKGDPELIAKAICLEIARLAKREKRKCLLYSFSGENQVISTELSFSTLGLKAIIEFLRSTFQGGTDVDGVLTISTKQAEKAEWEHADILIVSDGLFKLNRETNKRIKKLKETQNLRVHGVLVGGWRTEAMTSLCHPLHNFSLSKS